MWSRIYLIPLLQAEEDRDLVRRMNNAQKMEKELLGAETKVYHGDRYVSRTRTREEEGANVLQDCAADVRRNTIEHHQVDGEVSVEVQEEPCTYYDVVELDQHPPCFTHRSSFLFARTFVYAARVALLPATSLWDCRKGFFQLITAMAGADDV